MNCAVPRMRHESLTRSHAQVSFCPANDVQPKTRFVVPQAFTNSARVEMTRVRIGGTDTPATTDADKEMNSGMRTKMRGTASLFPRCPRHRRKMAPAFHRV